MAVVTRLVPEGSFLIGESNRIFVRTLGNEDDHALYELSKNEGFNLFSIHRYQMESVASARSKIIEWQKKVKETKKGIFGVFLKEKNQLFGICAIRPITIQDREITELMGRFHSDYWGNGYAIERGQICLNYAFENLKVKEVIVTVNPKNLRSKSVVRKLGFIYKENIIYSNVELELHQLSHDQYSLRGFDEVILSSKSAHLSKSPY